MAYKISENLKGKRAFITGAGGGLGRALSLKLAADGWTIGISDIKQEQVDETAGLINSAGAKALTYQFDVSKKEDYKKAFDDFILEVKSIDLLINNAGVGDGGLFGDYSLQNWDWITGIDLMGVIYGSHFAVPYLKKQQSGHIISIASAAGFANMPNMSMYNVSKAGVIALMETLHGELSAFNIATSVVCPTFFRSNIMQFYRGDKNSAAVGQTIIEKARYGPDEIAHYILTQAGKKKFYILHPYQSRVVYHIQRLFPEFFLNYKAKEFSKKDWIQKALSQKF
jgi:NAD(P)-dependent dehydrogenase (short-subunit alcohol dehydrogenase family)